VIPHFLYNLVLTLTYPLIKFMGFFSSKLSLFTEGRKSVFTQLKSKGVDQGKWVWFHVASLGEFEQALPLMVSQKKMFPKHKLLLTFFSPSGYEVKKDFELADCVCYLPWDTPKNTRRFLDFCNIECALLVKYEFWPNYLMGLSKREIPTYSVSSIFRSNQIFFKNYGKDYRKLLFGIQHFFVQNEASATLLKSIGIDKVTISGDTRMDRVYEISQKEERLSLIEQFLGGQSCFIAGSTWPEDYDLMEHVLKIPTDLKIIIVPHETTKLSIERLEKRIEIPYTKWSDFDEKRDQNKTVLIVDTIGQLTKIYRYAKFAYVGGGMKKNGLHNTLEPASFGIPVIIGKFFNRYEEAVSLLKKGGITSVNTSHEFKKIYDLLLHDASLNQKMGDVNAEYVKNGKGGSQMIIETIKSQMK